MYAISRPIVITPMTSPLLSSRDKLPVLRSPKPPLVLPMTLSYEHDTWTTVTTSRGTYHWPSSSTLQKTELWLATIQSPPSPLNPDAFHSYLRTHPGPLWVKQLVRGLREGFTVGYTGPRVTYRAPQRPHTPLAAQKIRDEFYDEVDLGRMLGPFTAPPNTGNFHFWRTAPTFAIPKKYGTKLRRIEHLSFPRGASVNDFIDKLDFPVHFATVDETITRIVPTQANVSLEFHEEQG